jgi:hypothetical protein
MKAALLDQDVLRCARWKPDARSDDELALLSFLLRTGRRSVGWRKGRGGCVEGSPDEDSAAKATQFQTCCENCEDEQIAKEWLVFRTQPEVIPAYSDPEDDRTGSGNCKYQNTSSAP